METLHLVAFPPGRSDLLEEMKACLGPDDAVVLLEAGAAMAGPGSQAAHARTFWHALPAHVLEDDLRMLGIEAAAESIERIDWDSLIALTEQAQRCLSWWP